MDKRTNSQPLRPPSTKSCQVSENDASCLTPSVNNIAHDLFALAAKREREERRQAKLRRENKKPSPHLLNKKKQLTIHDIDRLFEEKRLRPSAIRTDLTELYQKSTDRVRAMLNRNQIEQFLQTTQNRKSL